MRDTRHGPQGLTVPNRLVCNELQGTAGPPRLFLLETEYLRTVAAAELIWVHGVVEEIRTGRLNWRGEELAELAKQFVPPE